MHDAEEEEVDDKLAEHEHEWPPKKKARSATSAKATSAKAAGTKAASTKATSIKATSGRGGRNG